MKTRNFILSFLMMVFCSVAFGQNSYDWGEFNFQNYANSEQVIAVLELDGESVNGDFEIAPFCGTELRGNAVKAIEISGKKVYWFSVYGEAPETITFKLYDYATGTLFDNVSTTTVAFGDDEPNGSLNGPIKLGFNYVAKVADVKYGSLAKAIEKANNGGAK